MKFKNESQKSFPTKKRKKPTIDSLINIKTTQS